MINKQDIFNLRNLMYLYALSKTKNKKAVSDEFGISIDTLNKYIIDLENSIKTKLVFSNARGTMINPEGQLVLEIASEIAQKLHFFDSYVHGENQYRGNVRFCTSGPLIEYVSSPRFLDFTRLYPNIKVEANITSNASDLHALETDVSIDYFPPTDKDSVLIKEQKIKFGLFASPSYLEEHGRPKDLNDLYDNHRLCLKTGPSTKIPCVAGLVKNMKQIAYSSDSVMVFKTAPDSGLGIGFCPVTTGRRHLVLLDNLEFDYDVDVYLIAHRNTKDIPRIRVFINYIKNVLEKNYVI